MYKLEERIEKRRGNVQIRKSVATINHPIESR